jgi:hypothetical protein
MDRGMQTLAGAALVALALLMVVGMILNLPGLWFVIDVLVIGVCFVAGVTMLWNRPEFADGEDEGFPI